ncbi:MULTISPECIES: hypothetical protein [unclassified Serratia (in: enterobacteria)]|uniref:hypothetical protein n=1 Tax=unclassified Serratia (in: enterobacteria) TaxID=2647522 RepID=UPI000501A01C|nr:MULTISPECIES: hypothetical protein [unclassified Serratia (in: enterobacteria)]KFK92767.1 membrane protein [Serratia sp. Ag2]KFK98565.1 membrane protein [Serratia sp. Ag1]
MRVEVEFWALVGLLVTFMGFVFGVAKMFFAQLEKRQIEQFSSLDASLREFTNNLNTLEREFLEFKADLPIHYVRREDYVRGQTVIEAKLDAVYNKLELVQQHRLAGGKNG